MRRLSGKFSRARVRTVGGSQCLRSADKKHGDVSGGGCTGSRLRGGDIAQGLKIQKPTPGNAPARVLSLDGRWLDGQVVRQGGATSILRRCHQALGLAASNDEIPRPPELPLVEGKNGTGPSGGEGSNTNSPGVWTPSGNVYSHYLRMLRWDRG
jgi:hypothetical protein